MHNKTLILEQYPVPENSLIAKKAIVLYKLEIISSSNRCLRIGASKDEILPIFLKYNIEMNGSAEEKKKAIENKK